MLEMDVLLTIFRDYGGQLSALGAAAVFIFGVYKFQAERKATHYWKEFEVYHKLVKELVEPPAAGGLFVDRQAAIMYELRNFKRYYPYSLRMLQGLKQHWSTVPNQFPRLLDELDITIAFLEKRVG
jgi:hypothetical protein